jgi:hypothetical protein
MALSRGLKSQFATWIRQLEIPEPSVIQKLLHLDVGATFLNFNYTPSLTKLYEVQPSQIHHIHGSIAEADSDLVLGHAWNPGDRCSSNDRLDLEATDSRVTAGNELIDLYFRETFKPTERVIAAHRPFFEQLRGTEQIIVMGHSLEDVDGPYFQKIVRQINAGNVRWKISYHSDEGLLRLQRQFEKLIGVHRRLVQFAQLAEL